MVIWLWQTLSRVGHIAFRLIFEVLQQKLCWRLQSNKPGNTRKLEVSRNVEMTGLDPSNSTSASKSLQKCLANPQAAKCRRSYLLRSNRKHIISIHACYPPICEVCRNENLKYTCIVKRVLKLHWSPTITEEHQASEYSERRSSICPLRPYLKRGSRPDASHLVRKKCKDKKKNSDKPFLLRNFI